MGHDARAIIAANNNADLYSAVFAASGLRFERRPWAFVSLDRPPPYYSHLAVLSPDNVHEIEPLMHMLGRRFGSPIGVKDSFCELDLRANGATLLFEASWLWRSPAAVSPVRDWAPVESSRDLAKWEEAWKRAGSPTRARVFADALLKARDLQFLGKKRFGEFVAGCIANRSSDCVGISNVFSVDYDEAVFEEAAAAIESSGVPLPIAGYASGVQLAAAARAGFEMVGPLRVVVATIANSGLAT